MIKRLYPGGKRKAFNITYDDGVWQDVRFVELLNKYGIKGTFNLNSRLMEEEFEWTHECGLPVKRLPVSRAVKLYEGHEVASHTLNHPYMQNLSEDEIMYQLGHDKYVLEQIFGWEICGFAVPFDYYSGLIADCARRLGFEYARMSEESRSYVASENYYWWQCGIFHLSPGFLDFVEGFFDTDEELALCQIVGHSYDLDAENMWGSIETVLEKMAQDKDLASMTNLELVRYLKAMRSAQISDDYICNSSGVDLWFEHDGEVFCVNAGTSMVF